MPRRQFARFVLDTSILVRHWQRSRAALRGEMTPDAARQGARFLQDLHARAGLLTPVIVEFLGGARDRTELLHYRAFLAEFVVLDAGRILPSDWDNAQVVASRVPRDGRPRQLGDCLIRAIADRLNRAVVSHDKGFPLSSP